MRKRFAAALLACLMAVALIIPAHAVQTRVISGRPNLYFAGTTATCEFSYTKVGASIGVTMELWCGSAPVVIWTGRDKQAGHVQDPYRAERADLHTESLLLDQ